MKASSLAEKISSVLTTAPSQFDSDEEHTDARKAILNYENLEESDEHILTESQIRKQNVDYLADVDQRYAGKGGSRKNLTLSGEISSNDEIDHDSEGSESDRDVKPVSENDVSEEESIVDESEESKYENSDTDSEEDQTNFRTLKDDVTQVKKGACVKNQLIIWENLLEMRIQVQKFLILANRMPHHEKYKEIKNESGEEFTKSVQQVKKTVTSTLQKFLLLQNMLWKQFPELKKFKTDQLSECSNNEEILSDTGDELNEKVEETDEPSPKKKMKLSEFENEIKEKHTEYKEYRNSVMQKWYEKTRLPVMKNNAVNHSIINHLEHTLADKTKLIKRTQLKRIDYDIVGEEIDREEPDPNKTEEEYNSEIFDDNDFYHHLLRELIEVKSADLTDPVQLGRQWIQLQNMRSKMKRKIDTKATKGRKIRYAVHTKLVNFMAPIDNISWSDTAKTELFGSLFGKSRV